MSYEITVCPKEIDQCFKPTVKNYDVSEVSSAKDVLTAFCMNSYVENTESDLLALGKLHKSLQFYLRMYKSYIVEEWRQDLEKYHKCEDGYRFRGRQFSYDIAPYTINEYETTDDDKDVMSRLFLLTTTIKKPDFFEDSDRYYEYKNKIEELLEEYYDSLYTEISKCFVSTYRDTEVKYDDEDDDLQDEQQTNENNNEYVF